jgi:ectoine hydroxylase
MEVQDRYWTREGDYWEIADREDPVVWGDADEGPLTKTEVNEFERKGFLVKESLLDDDEVRRIYAEARRMARDYDKERPDVVTEPESNEVRSIFRVHVRNYLSSAVASDRRIAGVAEQLLGSDVYIHQSRINFKPGFAGNKFYWHSDFETWHEEDGMPRMRALSASILLTENYPFNGSLMLIPGSHKKFVRCPGQTPRDNHKQSLKRQRVGVPPQEAIEQLAEEHMIEQATGDAGSVLFFDCNVLHGSSGNMTPYARPNLFYVYNSTKNKLQQPFNGMEPRPSYLAEREHVSPVR